MAGMKGLQKIVKKSRTIGLKILEKILINFMSLKKSRNIALQVPKKFQAIIQNALEKILIKPYKFTLKKFQTLKKFIQISLWMPWKKYTIIALKVLLKSLKNTSIILKFLEQFLKNSIPIVLKIFDESLKAIENLF